MSAANGTTEKRTKTDKAVKRQKFLDVFPVLRDELVDYVKSTGSPEEVWGWFQRSLNYNVPGGKLNRGLSVVDTAEIIKGSDLTDDEYFKAAILGWSVELLQTGFLIWDDICDDSVTRRGQPCWYRVPKVGNIAINDAFMIESSIYYLLKKHFRQEKYYIDLIELFHEIIQTRPEMADALKTTFQTEIGQEQDLLQANEELDLNKHSMEKHHLIVVYKTAFYSFYLPVALAMRMFGIEDQAQYDAALKILIPLGEYFQIQDDYLDAFADPEVLGKIGTDILDNKCSWNINIALRHATPEQRQILDDNYGRKDSQSEAKVKEVFAQEPISIPARFEKYEQESHDTLTKAIGEIDESKGLKREVFTSFLEKVYKRTK